MSLQFDPDFPLFDGNKNNYFEFVSQFRLWLNINRIDDIILSQAEILKKLKKAKEEAAEPDVTQLTEDELKIKQARYTIAQNVYNALQARYNSEALQVTTLLQKSVTKTVFMNISQAATRIIAAYQTTDNKYSIHNYPRMISLWMALKLQYQPNLSESLKKARTILERLPANSSYADILNAVNTFISTVGRHPVQDDQGNQVMDPDTGAPMFEEVDPHTMKTIIIDHIRNSNNPAKYALIQDWHLDDASFETMYDNLKSIVLAEMEAPVIAAMPVVANTSAAALLPTTQSVANAAITDPHDVAPIRRTPNAFCKNCKRKGHFTFHCLSSRCETCDMNFPSAAERQRHSDSVHAPRQNNGFHRNNDRGRSSYSHHDNRNRHSHAEYRRRDDYQSRERSRSRSHDGNRNRNSKYGNNRPRSQSPHPRRHAQGNSSFRQDNSSRRPVSFANSAIETDEDSEY